jgi:LysM repeat protein
VVAVLEKAEIRPETPAGARPIKVLFNPTQYGFDGSNQFSETPVVGQTAPILQYTRGNSRSLSMELLFDTYEQGTDVRVHTNKIYKLLDVEPTSHRPPIVKFAWGGFTFRCLVERVSGRFTLFLDSGVPVRATLTVAFKEYVDPKEAPKGTRTESADHVKTYVVKRGDSLSSIAAAEYGDPATWRPIATANAIDNPRVLVPGRRLVIPPLPSRRGSA